MEKVDGEKLEKFDSNENAARETTRVATRFGAT